MPAGVRRPHTSCRTGKRVRIVLRSGEEIIGKFKESTDSYVFLEDGKKIPINTIRSFGIYRKKA